MANQVVTVTYDRFKNSTNSQSVHLHYNLKTGMFGGWATIKLFLLSTKNDNEDSLGIIAFFESDDWVFLRNGSLQLRLDDKTNIEIKAQNLSTNVIKGNHITEGVGYFFSKETLKSICDATKLEARITGSKGRYEIDLQDFLSVARVFYNQVYDNTMYTDETCTVKSGCLGIIISGIIVASTIGTLLL